MFNLFFYKKKIRGIKKKAQVGGLKNPILKNVQTQQLRNKSKNEAGKAGVDVSEFRPKLNFCLNIF